MAIGVMGMTSPSIVFSIPFYSSELFGLISTPPPAISETTTSSQWLLTRPFSSVVWIALTTSAAVFLAAVCITDHVIFHRIPLRDINSLRNRCYDNDQDIPSQSITSSLVRSSQKKQETTVTLRRMIGK